MSQSTFSQTTNSELFAEFLRTLNPSSRAAFDRLDRQSRKDMYYGWRRRVAQVNTTISNITLASTISSQESWRYTQPLLQVQPEALPEEPYLVQPPPVTMIGHTEEQPQLPALYVIRVSLSDELIEYNPNSTQFKLDQHFANMDMGEELFIIIWRPHSSEFCHRLELSKQAHPPGLQGIVTRKLAWPLEGVLEEPSRDKVGPHAKYERVLEFNDAVVRVWSMAWPATPGSHKNWGLSYNENQHACVGQVIHVAICQLGTRDATRYLPVMALAGNVFLVPKDSLDCGVLEDMSRILEFYRGEILRQKRPLPKGHTAENFLMECLFLGAVFPVECGLLRLSS